MAKETITSGAGVLWSAIVTMLNNMFTEVYSRLFPAQSVENTPVQIAAIVPKTTGAATFEIGFNSFANGGGGLGTYNHGCWFGFNSGHHSALPVTASKPSIIMGFEDNYFDTVGDLKYGAEWYIEGYSPNGTTIANSRPYYCRGLQADDGTDWWTVISNIGSSGTHRSFSVHAGASSLINISPATFNSYIGLNAGAGILVSGGNLQVANNHNLQFINSTGTEACTVMTLTNTNTLYIGDMYNNTGGNVYIRGGGTNRVNCNATGLSFNDVAPIAKPLLATGAGATVDNVITVLQNLGLVKQS